jgi:hypothetical protein
MINKRQWEQVQGWERRGWSYLAISSSAFQDADHLQDCRRVAQDATGACERTGPFCVSVFAFGQKARMLLYRRATACLINAVQRCPDRSLITDHLEQLSRRQSSRRLCCYRTLAPSIDKLRKSASDCELLMAKAPRLGVEGLRGEAQDESSADIPCRRPQPRTGTNTG